MSVKKRIKSDKEGFWELYHRLNGARYEDEYTVAYRRLKDMYTYNYSEDFNDDGITEKKYLERMNDAKS